MQVSPLDVRYAVVDSVSGRTQVVHQTRREAENHQRDYPKTSHIMGYVSNWRVQQ